MSSPLRLLANHGGCDHPFLGFPSWTRGLTIDGANCTISNFALNGVWVIVLNVLEILLRVGALMAVGYIIYGGFKMISSQGQPDHVKSAKDTITNAVVGVIITMVSATAVSVIAQRVAGTAPTAESSIGFKLPIVSPESALEAALNLALLIGGGLSIIFIIVGGLKYTTSTGDPNQTNAAKNTILYAIIGLVFSLLAFTIVQIAARALA
jgi:TRAP-type C4-dicarboxylate transport system permease small subunit